MFDRVEEVRVAGSANVCMGAQWEARFGDLGLITGRKAQWEMALDIGMRRLYV